MMMSVHTRRPRLHWVETPIPVVERMPNWKEPPHWARTFGLAVLACLLLKGAGHLLHLALLLK